jgi:hypothetical protein
VPTSVLQEAAALGVLPGMGGLDRSRACWTSSPLDRNALGAAPAQPAAIW